MTRTCWDVPCTGTDPEHALDPAEPLLFVEDRCDCSYLYSQTELLTHIVKEAA